VLLRRVFPGLGEGTIVPDVAVVGEAVAHETELALFDVCGVRCVVQRMGLTAVGSTL
jgi:hypothetical protein